MQPGTDYPEFDGFDNYKETKLVWMSGDLTLGEWRKEEAQEPGCEFFQLKKGEERTVFLANETYFPAGFARMLTASEVLKMNIGIPVACLVRVMWYVSQAKNFVACPHGIIERSGDSSA
jgi:hypothetical protein